MEAFGWKEHERQVEELWRGCVKPDDLVCIAGDISWAARLEQARADLDWIGTLPGTKVFIKGNHDYWCASPSKVRSSLPPTMHYIQNDCFNHRGVAVAGTRLWDGDFSFDSICPGNKAPLGEEDQKIYQRELTRLEMSLKQLTGDLRICMTHYPPIPLKLEPTPATLLMEKYNVDICLFGHLHGIQSDEKLFGEMNGVHYHLTSCDYLKFKPLLVHSL